MAMNSVMLAQLMKDMQVSERGNIFERQLCGQNVVSVNDRQKFYLHSIDERGFRWFIWFFMSSTLATLSVEARMNRRDTFDPPIFFQRETGD